MITAGMAGSEVSREILGQACGTQEETAQIAGNAWVIDAGRMPESPAGAGIELASWAPLTIPWPLYLSPIAAAFNA
jgi:hypothetical protein